MTAPAPRRRAPRGVPRRAVAPLAAALVALAAGACGTRDTTNSATKGTATDARDALVVYNAGSLARPLRAALDSFARREGVRAVQESAGSLETVRKLTELGRTPDVVALADADLFPRLLSPAHTRWYATFAGNRVVVAINRDVPVAAGTEWYDAVTMPGVEVGRADPDVDPGGYRALLVAQLAERYYHVPGLAARLVDAAPARNIRPKESDLVALVQSGELDYVWVYESVARAAKLPFVRLPDEIDLGTPAESTLYAAASVRVRGARPGDTITVRGAPIAYAASVPAGAPHRAAAERFVAFLLSADGRRALAAGGLPVRVAPRVVGDAPAVVAAAAQGTVAAGTP